MTPNDEKIDNTFGAMAYVLGWLSAIYFVNAERRVIRFHAMQSIVVFGGLMLSVILADSIFPWDTSNPLMYLIRIVVMSGLLLISFVLWFLLPFQTYRGKPFLVPIFAPITTRWAGAPPWREPSDLPENSAPPWQQPPDPPAKSVRPFSPVSCPKCGANWTPGAGSCSKCGEAFS